MVKRRVFSHRMPPPGEEEEESAHFAHFISDAHFLFHFAHFHFAHFHFVMELLGWLNEHMGKGGKVAL